VKLAVFISGRGSNMEALLRACREPDFPAEIVLVLSNRPDAPGLEIAKAAGIATVVVDHKDFPDKPAFEAALDQALAGHQVELICLAGFMRLLSADFIARWPGKIINIHPSLLPAYKGLNTHERVLADQRRETGCSVHFVSAEMDAGPVILQEKVAVAPGDTAQSLAARVLEAEHRAYPEAVRLIAQGKVRPDGEKVEIC